MFWIILGILIGAGFVFLLMRKPVKMAWLDWVLLALAVIFALLAIQNYTASLEELEPKAAAILLVMFGLPAVIFSAIVGVRAWRSRPAIPAKS